jgi:hypothetical protein
MFHVEMRDGLQSVRAFNLSEEALDAQFLAPLMADAEFSYEGHEWTPRKTRLKIFEGPQLRPDQLGLGRGWQNVERKGSDVTEAILDRARAHVTLVATQPPATIDALRERLIGRLSGGPVSFEDVVAMAAELMPATTVEAQLAAAERAAVEVLQAGSAHLAR